MDPASSRGRVVVCVCVCVFKGQNKDTGFWQILPANI